MYLVINEIFSSFQGEGLNTGLPTTFVRLSGCNIRCAWCDTRYALDTGSGKRMEISEIIDSVSAFGNERICLTGGEPLFQDGIDELISELIRFYFKVDLETNGTYHLGEIIRKYPDVFISMDVKTPSSGEAGSTDPGNLPLLRHSDQIKFIVKDARDIDYTMDFLRSNPVSCSIIITPCSNEDGDEAARIIARKIDEYRSSGREDLISMSRRIRLMVQTHRVIWGERRGV
ncbi:MAG: 7-carboxy-7-deazaguanine synthase QueE [Thermoplasmatota archaeon]